MFNAIMQQLRENAINETVDICEKTEFMDSYLFYNKIKNMSIEEIGQIASSMAILYQLRELNKGIKATKKSIIRKVM